jgi:hypothetical protein
MQVETYLNSRWSAGRKIRGTVLNVRDCASIRCSLGLATASCRVQSMPMQITQGARRLLVAQNIPPDQEVLS